ncbi:protein AAR2 homolog [Euwallacea fornicatus]|uniref:protein AAR2 homolog n=1 Tax=Euwallacea fornicatus TaxID=995702 RepID=UPI00338FCFDA
MEIDQSTAQRLFREGAFLVFLDVPEGTEFGIDLKSWNTGQKFRGVKMIPPGLHFIFYSSVSNMGDVAPRSGFIHNFKKNEIVVKKWDKLNEGMHLESVSESEVVGLKENIKALDQFLGPYPYNIWEKWKALSADISEELLKRLTPLSGEVRSALELEPCTDANRPRGNRSNSESNSEASGPSSAKRSRSFSSEEDFLPDLKPKKGTELRLTVFPTQPYPDGSTPSQITQHSLDSTYLFEQYLRCYKEPRDLLGELEFCYICFLVGHSLEAFEQWKKVFNIFCSCENAIKKYRRVYDLFLSVIELQIQETPTDFLVDIVANKNFVYVKLRELFRAIKSSDVDGKLKCKASRLKVNMSNLYQWDFSHLESEDEDEAPVVVDLDE